MYENAVMLSRDGVEPSPYRPDVSLSDFHVFSSLKIALKSHTFGLDEEWTEPSLLRATVRFLRWVI
jgi:hypothetical protein